VVPTAIGRADFIRQRESLPAGVVEQACDDLRQRHQRGARAAAGQESIHAAA
jgi:hypothetical protein